MSCDFMYFFFCFFDIETYAACGVYVTVAIQMGRDGFSYRQTKIQQNARVTEFRLSHFRIFQSNSGHCVLQGIGPACTDSLDGGVTLDERQLILEEHNSLRSRVASGSETRGLPPGAPQPPAANMMALVQRHLFISSLLLSLVSFFHDMFSSPNIMAIKSRSSR
jgi:hypothetical protein